MSQSQDIEKHGANYSDMRASVSNYRPRDEREKKIHGYMKEGMKKIPYIKTLARHDSKMMKKAKHKALESIKK